eukprot:Phypoly_transcript_14605.p1 GENE.Phypoly_transcript_14605~~Phypoly_transcript_14605.p1  ORF type:complete len:124 (+),score=33.42 Phypoly_transcript_14605:35-373(+)
MGKKKSLNKSKENIKDVGFDIDTPEEVEIPKKAAHKSQNSQNQELQTDKSQNSKLQNDKSQNKLQNDKLQNDKSKLQSDKLQKDNLHNPPAKLYHEPSTDKNDQGMCMSMKL